MRLLRSSVKFFECCNAVAVEFGQISACCYAVAEVFGKKIIVLLCGC